MTLLTITMFSVTAQGQETALTLESRVASYIAQLTKKGHKKTILKVLNEHGDEIVRSAKGRDALLDIIRDRSLDTDTRRNITRRIHELLNSQAFAERDYFFDKLVLYLHDPDDDVLHHRLISSFDHLNLVLAHDEQLREKVFAEIAMAQNRTHDPDNTVAWALQALNLALQKDPKARRQFLALAKTITTENAQVVALRMLAPYVGDDAEIRSFMVEKLSAALGVNSPSNNGIISIAFRALLDSPALEDVFDTFLVNEKNLSRTNVKYLMLAADALLEKNIRISDVTALLLRNLEWPANHFTAIDALAKRALLDSELKIKLLERFQDMQGLERKNPTQDSVLLKNRNIKTLAYALTLAGADIDIDITAELIEYIDMHINAKAVPPLGGVRIATQLAAKRNEMVREYVLKNLKNKKLSAERVKWLIDSLKLVAVDMPELQETLRPFLRHKSWLVIKNTLEVFEGFKTLDANSSKAIADVLKSDDLYKASTALKFLHNRQTKTILYPVSEDGAYRSARQDKINSVLGDKNLEVALVSIVETKKGTKDYDLAKMILDEDPGGSDFIKKRRAKLAAKNLAAGPQNSTALVLHQPENCKPSFFKRLFLALPRLDKARRKP